MAFRIQVQRRCFWPTKFAQRTVHFLLKVIIGLGMEHNNSYNWHLYFSPSSPALQSQKLGIERLFLHFCSIRTNEYELNQSATYISYCVPFLTFGETGYSSTKNHIIIKPNEKARRRREPQYLIFFLIIFITLFVFVPLRWIFIILYQ